ncbi:peptidyl-tRNA hydrolase [Candidatus Nitrosoglobus terrae]|uniref:Peptidyl-tRNA hydrolase n=1 Tax=Candidatus Nitrosoglobus terrae TaxID=1630141 RepID=A0A1Q2SPY7_9GAMM|nr:aminoacyl-tRNA hydrolase [Candidatus Nitrosoglobus terrae]BAW81173.1 peptidyl-tRNA hydrolase [Candidatus Nitrosoglobus terrae]
MSTPIWLLVGLGNPGSQYAQSRHNVGFWWVENLARELGARFKPEAKFFGDYARMSWCGHDILLLKPTTFMNHSGQAVLALLSYYQIPPQQLCIIHDDLDLPSGVARLKREGGHGGHNGLRDIINRLGLKHFLRLRLGIGHPGNGQDVVGYVLSRPSVADQLAIEVAITAGIKILPEVLAGEVEKAMHRLHSAV